MFEIFLLFLAGHFIADFAFQSTWMAENKGKSWEINGYHAAVYAATIFLIAKIGGVALSPFIVFIFFITHFFIDPLKARFGIIKNIWVDQSLHIAVIIGVLFLI